MFVYVLQGLGLGFSAAVQPGPFQAFVLSQAMARGWQRTLPIALAPAISDGPIIALMLFVFSQVPGWLEQVLYIAGGLFMLFLAWDAYRSWRDADPEASTLPEPPTSGSPSVFKAALMNVLGPGPYVFWGTVGVPILIAAWRASPAYAIGFLGGFFVAMASALAALIVLFGTARRFGPKVSRALVGVSTIVLACFGFYQLWMAFSRMGMGL